MQVRACAVVHAMSVRLSMSRSFIHSLETNKRVVKFFSPSASHTILGFGTKHNGNISTGTPEQGRRMQME